MEYGQKLQVIRIRSALVVHDRRQFAHGSLLADDSEERTAGRSLSGSIPSIVSLVKFIFQGNCGAIQFELIAKFLALGH
jgi:hypothetical protein